MQTGRVEYDANETRLGDPRHMDVTLRAVDRLHGGR